MNTKTAILVTAALVTVFIGSIPHHFYMWFTAKFSTYPGDIWYVFDHYVSKGWPFPVEYPSLMRVFVQLVNTVTTSGYTRYLWTTIYFLVPFIVGTTVLMSLVQQKQRSRASYLWLFWVLAPSFIVCSTTNYDHVALFALVAALYLAWQDRPVPAAAALAVGTAFKVFPFFFLPLICLVRKEPKDILKVLGAFFGTWLYLNIPYMFFHDGGLSGWLYPYAWQASQNFAKGPGDGSLWWLLFRLTGRSSGMISLCLTFSAITLLTWKASESSTFREDIWQWARGIALIYLLFDRIYSPQYHLYLLPFLALSTSPIHLLLFYMLDLTNASQLLFLFSVRQPPYLLQPLIVIKYIALVLLALQFYRQVIMGKRVIPSGQEQSSSPRQ